MAPHPFRFSVQCPLAPDARSWVELARKAEDLGFSTLTISDHFDDQLAPGPALVAAADATTTLRVGTLVYCNDYRHPVVLAKEAATVDLLSEGRLELGLGAGWMPADYEQAGLAMDPAGVRIARLEEAVVVIKGLLGDGLFTFRGEHYEIAGLDGQPAPVQRPHPPLLIGGGGRRMLELAARHADIVGINVDLRSGEIGPGSGPSATAEATRRKVGWIRGAAGDRFDDLELHVRIHLAQRTDDRAALAQVASPAFGLTPEEGLTSPHALAGTVDEMVEQCLRQREELGISYIGIGAEAMDDLAPVVARLVGT